MTSHSGGLPPLARPTEAQVAVREIAQTDDSSDVTRIVDRRNPAEFAAMLREMYGTGLSGVLGQLVTEATRRKSGSSPRPP